MPVVATSKPPLEPRRWTPPPVVPAPPAVPVFVETWEMPGVGPEDVAVLEDGSYATGLEDGRVLRVWPDGQKWELIAQVEGRPLGIETTGDSLVVSTAFEGLLRIDIDSGDKDVLTREVGGKPILLPDNATVASDGTIFFSDSSQRYTLDVYRRDLLEHTATGRLLRRAPDGEVDVLIEGLAFSNGVTMAPDESFVLVAETGGYAIHRHWLTGERTGTTDLFASGLPGFPDNLTTGPSGTIWCAIPSPRNALLDRLLPGPPILRKVLGSIPESMQPGPEKVCTILGFAVDGTITHHLQAPGEQYYMTTGVREHEGHLLLGSVEMRSIGRVRIPG